QVFNGDDIKAVNDATAVLVGAITPSPSDTFMDSCHNLAPSGTLRCVLLFFRETTLCVGKLLFLFAKDAWAGNLGASGKHWKGLQSYVDAHALPRICQWHWLDAFARKRDIPLTRATALYRGSLRSSFQWSMQEHIRLPDVHDAQAFGFRIRLATHR